MTAIELRVEREELCHTFGFDNRWTAMIFQWCRDEFGFNVEDIPVDELAENCREFVLTKGVHESRIDGVRFHDVAGALMTVALAGIPDEEMFA
jgi:hypothetical protein